MDKRQAKRIASDHCADIVRSTLEGGWTTLEEQGLDDDDRAKIEDAMWNIIERLEARHAAGQQQKGHSNDEG